ncbi:MAG TPA: hypothetical protein VI504_11535 [Candidatus Eisenbacteria bacterium]
MRDPALAGALRERLERLGIAIEPVSRLPLIDEAVADMTHELIGDSPPNGYLDQRGVTLERLRAFADAAAEFYRAAIWNYLSGEDLVRVESAAPERSLAWFVVLGAAQLEHGLGFYSSAGDFERFAEAAETREPALQESRWSLTFAPTHELPYPDSDAWIDHALPVAAPRAHPFLARMGHGELLDRPDAAQLSYVEGLLRSLALTVEDDLDAGRWQKTVPTADGAREYVFALPDVLDPPPVHAEPRDRRGTERVIHDLEYAMSQQKFANAEEMNEFLAGFRGRVVPHAPADTPRQQAAEKYYAALDAAGRLRVKLAREAIALWPDYADAWALRAEEMPDIRKSREFWKRALQAATRELGAAAFREHAGNFWNVLATRPYMRARDGLAHADWALGDRIAATENWLDLMDLDPDDHLGVREVLVPRLLDLGRDDEAAKLLEQYADDPAAIFAFSRALLAFRRDGASPRATAALASALRANRHALKYLIRAAAPDPTLDDGYYRPGDEREAAIIFDELGRAFEATAGAVAWLRKQRRDGKKTRKKQV